MGREFFLKNMNLISQEFKYEKQKTKNKEAVR